MSTLHFICPRCKKKTSTQSEAFIGKTHVITLQCGHLHTKALLSPIDEAPGAANSTPIPEPKAYDTQTQFTGYLQWAGALEPYKKAENQLHESFYSYDKSKSAMPFQVDGIRFAEKTQLRCLLADEMGLGKTIEAILAIKRNGEVAFPCIVLVKGSTTFQWANEIRCWVEPKLMTVIPVTSREGFIPGFNFYVVSMDFIGRKGVCEAISKLSPKSIVVDECQSFKDLGSQRTGALQRIVRENGIEFILALSGTPIKNRVSEYFPILNLLAPNVVSSEIGFKRQWLIQDEKGQYSKVNPYREEAFKSFLSNFVIRRTKAEVLTNLPPLRRDFQLIEIRDQSLRNSYNVTLGLFRNFMMNNAKVESSQILGWLAKLRHITGQAKCVDAVEFALDFLDSTEESLAIGIHHKGVLDTLKFALDMNGVKALTLSGSDDVYAKSRIQTRFNAGVYERILILNELAGGVGLNLQSCPNVLTIEMPWNSADFEQFEARFHRNGQKTAVTSTVLIARNTIDEYMHNDMMFTKSHNIASAGIGEGWDLTESLGSLKDFADKVMSGKNL